MNYYEELGLTSEASVEEIRQAYRNLTRLLHPDQQTAEEMKRLAECQMKRLNAIHAVLADPVQRHKYDMSLTEEAAALNSPSPLTVTAFQNRFGKFASWLATGHGVWLLIAGIGAATLYWSLRFPQPRTVVHIYQPVPAVELNEGAQDMEVATSSAQGHKARGSSSSSGISSAEVRGLREQIEAARAERDAVRSELARLQTAESGSFLPPSAGSAATPQAASYAAIRRDEPRQLIGLSPTTSERSSFAGTWFWVPPKVAPTSRSLYPPEYIEAVIVEENGVLRGRYRARYHVTDRAISPEVFFQFEGKTRGAETASLLWTGFDGAKGELRLRLISDNSMEVNWTAVELGKRMGLAAGTAVLIRRQER